MNPTLTLTLTPTRDSFMPSGLRVRVGVGERRRTESGFRGSRREVLLGRILTPALSPSEGERGNRWPSVRAVGGASRRTTGACHCGTNGATGLPLPLRGGEGWGEGAAA